MSVELSKPPHVLVVHGVQRGGNRSVAVDRRVRALIAQILEVSHISKRYTVRAYRYADLNRNDRSVRLARLIASALTAGKPLAGAALRTAINLIGDVVIAAADNSTAGRIRQGLRRKILASHADGHRVLLIAHSLGSYYALEVINELIAEGRFTGDDRRKWPVQGLVTLGSPLGLDFALGELAVFPEVSIERIGSDSELLPWHNFYTLHDPIVSGRIFGRRVETDGTYGPVEQRYHKQTKPNGWLLHGHTITVGRRWLLAHTGYWKDSTLGVNLVSMLWG